MTYLNNLKNILSNKKFDFIILLTTTGLLNGHNIYASLETKENPQATNINNKESIPGEDKNPETGIKSEKELKYDLKDEKISETENQKDSKKDDEIPEIIAKEDIKNERPEIKKEKRIEIEDSLYISGLLKKNAIKKQKTRNTSELKEMSMITKTGIGKKIQLSHSQDDDEEESAQVDPTIESKVVDFLKKVNENKNVASRLKFLNNTGRFRINKGGCLCCSNLENGSVTVFLPNGGFNQQMPTMTLKEIVRERYLYAEEDKQENNPVEAEKKNNLNNDNSENNNDSEKGQVQPRLLKDYNEYMYGMNDGHYKSIAGYLDFAGSILFTELEEEGMDVYKLQKVIKELDENFIADQTEDEGFYEVKSMPTDPSEDMNKPNENMNRLDEKTITLCSPREGMNEPNGEAGTLCNLNEKTSGLDNMTNIPSSLNENINEPKNRSSLDSTFKPKVNMRKAEIKYNQHNREREHVLSAMSRFKYAKTPQGKKFIKNEKYRIKQEKKKFAEEEEELIKKELSVQQIQGCGQNMGLNESNTITTNNRNKNDIGRKNRIQNTQRRNNKSSFVKLGKGISYTQQVIENLSENELSNNNRRKKGKKRKEEKNPKDNLNNKIDNQTDEKDKNVKNVINEEDGDFFDSESSKGETENNLVHKKNKTEEGENKETNNLDNKLDNKEERKEDKK